MSTRFIIHFLGVSFSALTLAAPALAETQPASPPAVQEVVVTGSHIAQSGYVKPTPVTVVSGDQIQQTTPASFVQAITQLPAFLNSESARNSGGRGQAGDASKGGTYLNLRNLGINRNLILMDGLRVPPTTSIGGVDIQSIPELLVQRVEVVTAGVSAVYGSDAVTGVVNFVLDDNFTGFKGVAQGGGSTYHDGGSYKIGVAFGTKFLDDRLHAIVSFEHQKQDNVNKDARPLSALGGLTGPGTPVGTPGTASAPYRFILNTGSSNVAPLGDVTAGLPGFNNVTFTTTGAVRAVIPGGYAASNSWIGGDYSQFPQHTVLIYGPSVDQAFARLSFDVTPKINAYADVAVLDTDTHYRSQFPSIRAGIQLGNAFLPAEAKAAIAAAVAGGANPADPNPAADRACGFGTIGLIGCYALRIPYGLSPPDGVELQHESTSTIDFRVGIKGDLIWGWKFDAAYVYGHAYYHSAQANELDQGSIYAAMDSVINPATGQPVCRVTLTNPTAYPGCVPFNWVNVTSEPQAAWDFIRGFSWLTVVNKTNDLVFNLTGSPFATWAGPVEMAFGAEWRDGSLSQISNSDPRIPLNCTGVNACNPNTGRFLSGTNAIAQGHRSVTEGYVEGVIPLAKDMVLAHSVELNGAFRYTSYSTSGGVYTWKVGGTYEPVPDLRLRITRSHDIRAPTLFDLYSGATSTRGTFIDPHCNCQALQGTFVFGGGNPDLKPEIADTLTYGAIFQPRFVPGFSASIDYYDLNMTGVITTLLPQQVISLCDASGGTAAICSQIVRPNPFSDHSPANVAFSVFAGTINAAFVHTRGLDMEASYHTPVHLGRLDGDLTLHGLVNYVLLFDYQAFAGQPVQSIAGLANTGPNTNVIDNDLIDQAIPRWQGTLTATYAQGPLTLIAQTRMISQLKMGPAVYVIDHLPAIAYADFSVSYAVPVKSGKVEFFFTVNNAFNQQPPFFPSALVEGFVYPTLQSLYDVMGRYYTAGARFRF